MAEYLTPEQREYFANHPGSYEVYKARCARMSWIFERIFIVQVSNFPFSWYLNEDADPELVREYDELKELIHAR